MTFKQARTESGLSLRGLVRATGLTYSSVTSIQAGTQKPQYATALKLARALGMDPMDIDELRPAVEEFEAAIAG